MVPLKTSKYFFNKWSKQWAITIIISSLMYNLRLFSVVGVIYLREKMQWFTIDAGCQINRNQRLLVNNYKKNADFSIVLNGYDKKCEFGGIAVSFLIIAVVFVRWRLWYIFLNPWRFGLLKCIWNKREQLATNWAID